MDYHGRQTQLLESLRQQRLDGMLISHMPNVRYLCGFTGSSGVLAIRAGRRARTALFTDGRYTTQAKEEVKGASVKISPRPVLILAAEWLHQGGLQNTGFESQHLSVADLRRLQTEIRGMRLKPAADLVERQRMIKEPSEIKQMRQAAELASRVFDALLADIRPGTAESDVAAELEYLCRRMGAEGMSFNTLVAAGVRSALPHGVASKQPIPPKGFVILDFGVILGGYCSDMTRTVHVGKPDSVARKMYAAVRDAQQRALDAVRPGAATVEVDRAARGSLESAGYGRFFTHSTGHGVGLEIHEQPGLRSAPRSKKKRLAASGVLEPGMVVTIEPGIYIPGVGGVRIEDMVAVTASGYDLLTPTTKDLITI